MNILLAALAAVLCGGACVCAEAAQKTGPAPTSEASQVARGVQNAPDAATSRPDRKARKDAPVHIPRFESAPAIDGSLDDEAWKGAATIGDFVQTEPGENVAPSRPTEVLLGYDAEHLYVAFRATDEPDKVRSTVARRDAVEDDDYVGLYLDTFDDKRRAYALFFNALGVQADGVYAEGRGEDLSVDFVMESKGALTPNGYVVEIAIPFRSLRYRAGEGRLWGAQFFRRIQRFDAELDQWQPISRENSSYLSQAGHVTGLDDVPATRTLEITPTLAMSEAGRRVPAAFLGQLAADPTLVDRGRFVNKPIGVDPGLAIKLVFTPNVTLDVAVNPDFAEVESDAPVSTANLRFPVFFEEKRPFFLEGVDIFQTPLDPVHTRTIVDPDVAAKLTGKVGRTSFGLLVASDNAPGNYSDEERRDPDVRAAVERYLDRNASIGVLRLKRDMGAENTLGMVATSYDFVDLHDKVAGVDGRFRLGPITTLEFQALGTFSRRFLFDQEEGRERYATGNGFGYSGQLNVDGRNYNLQLAAHGRSSNYFADVGFSDRTNTNVDGLLVSYDSTPREKAAFVSWQTYNFSHVDYDWQGRMQIAESETGLQWNFAHQTWFAVAYEKAWERVFEGEFGPVRTPERPGAFAGPDDERSSSKHHYFVSGGTQPSKQFSAYVRMVFRDGHFDYDFGAGPEFPRVSPAALGDPNAPFDPGPGGLWQFSSSLAFQPTDALRTTLDVTKNRLRRYDTMRVAFDETILSSRTTYQFTKFTFARARVDYDTLSSHATGQFVLGWTPSPGTSIYAGYTDDVAHAGFNPFSGELEPGLRRSARSFFVTASYMFRFGL